MSPWSSGRAWATLKALCGAALRLQAESVEHTGVGRKVLSAAARALENEGFLFICGYSTIWSPEFDLLPALAREESLEVLDESTV